MRTLLDSVARSLESRGLVPWDRRILVAVSGGVDSMVLLHLLHTLSPKLDFQLVVAHAHHQLRPRAADTDEALVRQVSIALGWPFVIERLEVRRESRETGESLEMSARRLRHEFLARTALRHGISTVAVAHHADDQAELVLLRLLRGAGGEGLGGMSWQDPSPANPRISLIRPLLDLSKEQLRNAARAAGLPFREDRSNRDPRMLRNRIRHQLLPRLEREYAPAIRILLRRTASIVGAESDFISRTAAGWLASRRRDPFDSLHPAVQRALLRIQLWKFGQEPGYERIESLRESNRVQEIAPGVRIVRHPDGILRKVDATPLPSFRGEGREIRLESSGGWIHFDGLRIEYSYRNIGRASPRFSPGRECFAASKVRETIVLRHWAPGDRFRPLGMSKPVKLQDLFTNRKIPRERRRDLTVAATRAGEIFWVEGFPPGEAFKIGPRLRRILIWKWRSAA